MSAESRDLLERLLREAAGSATTGALHDAAADGGHPDEAELKELLAGTIDADRARALRRHILFCDSCTARMANQTVTAAKPVAAVAAAATIAAPSRPPKPTDMVPVAARRRLRIIFAGCGLLLALLAGHFILKATDDRGEVVEEPFMPVDTLLAVNSIGPDGEEQRGLVRVGLSVAIEIVDRLGDGEQYVYVLLVDGRGDVHVLEPRSGPAATFAIDGALRLPRSPEGWKLDEVTAVAVGDELAFLFVASPERIGVFEGEIARIATTPRFGAELKEIWPPQGEQVIEEVMRRYRAFRFGGVVRGLQTRVLP